MVLGSLKKPEMFGHTHELSRATVRYTNSLTTINVLQRFLEQHRFILHGFSIGAKKSLSSNFAQHVTPHIFMVCAPEKYFKICHVIGIRKNK